MILKSAEMNSKLYRTIYIVAKMWWIRILLQLGWQFRIQKIWNLRIFLLARAIREGQLLVCCRLSKTLWWSFFCFVLSCNVKTRCVRRNLRHGSVEQFAMLYKNEIWSRVARTITNHQLHQNSYFQNCTHRHKRIHIVLCITANSQKELLSGD